MEKINVIWHYLGSLQSQSCPYHVLVIKVSNVVQLFLKGIKKGTPSGSYPKYSKHIYALSLLITFPPIFIMRKSFKEIEGDLFIARKKLNRVVTL